MFDETKLATPYFQQMTLYSKIPNIIPQIPKNGPKYGLFGVECALFWSGVSIILIILGAECFS
jgi:hypothetical protein